MYSLHLSRKYVQSNLQETYFFISLVCHGIFILMRNKLDLFDLYVMHCTYKIKTEKLISQPGPGKLLPIIFTQKMKLASH